MTDTYHSDELGPVTVPDADHPHTASRAEPEAGALAGSFKTVWKFTFAITDGPQPATMPAAAVPLSVQMQGGALCLWVEVFPEAPKVERLFAVHGTGHPVPVGRWYVGTAQQPPLVWHLYEVGA